MDVVDYTVSRITRQFLDFATRSGCATCVVGTISRMRVHMLVIVLSCCHQLSRLKGFIGKLMLLLRQALLRYELDVLLSCPANLGFCLVC